MRKPFFLGLLSLFLCLNASAQVPHGGEPLWQDQPELSDVPVHRMPGIDLDDPACSRCGDGCGQIRPVAFW